MPCKYSLENLREKQLILEKAAARLAIAHLVLMNWS